MKKWKQKSAMLRKMLALTLAVVIAAGMLPMKNVQALRRAAAMREEIDFKDWSETEEKEEETPQETQVSEKEENAEKGTVKDATEKQVTQTAQADETITEETSLNEDETITEETSFDKDETITEESSVDETITKETLAEELTSEETLVEEVSTEELSKEEATKEEFGFTLSADQDGVYDYRTHYGTTPYLYITMNKGWSSEQEKDDTDMDKNPKEEGEIVLQIKSYNEAVIMTDISRAEALEWEDTPISNAEREYLLADGKIPLVITGTGKTTLEVHATMRNTKLYASQRIVLEVKNSPLRDEDFEISILDKDNKEIEKFTSFSKWQEYLAAHDNWINDNVRIGLTETGLKYYNVLKITNGGAYLRKKDQYTTIKDEKIREHVLWAENSTTKASSNFEKRSFYMGIDKTAPILLTFLPAEDCYKLTSTEDMQYFSKNFVLTGSFRDVTSGIVTLAYTTNINAEGGAEWKTLETFTEPTGSVNFTLELENGIYDAVAVRAVDQAGNMSEPACLKNENNEFIKVVVDDMPPDIEVLAVSEGESYNAEGENWTNKEIQFTISEKLKKDDDSSSIMQFDGYIAGLYSVEYAYQSIASVLRGEVIKDDAWHPLEIDDDGKAFLYIGKDNENPVNQNGYYYFKGRSKAGVENTSYIAKRVLLWQEMAPKKPILQTDANLEKCYNEWYNIASGVPVLDFEYPEYDTGVISGEYAAPITIHYNLSVKDEKDITTSIAEDKTACIRTSVPETISTDNSFTGFTAISDDLSTLQITFPQDGIYTLTYWTTDAAGNESEKDRFLYKIDCNEPTDLKLILADEERALGNENSLLYEKFYREGISGQATAAYGISGKESIKIIKAKKIGDWKKMSPNEDAEHFTIEPNMRCLLYIRATDGAGNMTEGWTRGIVVDNEAPTGDGTQEMIIEPAGANKNGFFNKDVKLNISIKDSPTDNNSAALKLVTESINVGGVDLVSEKELFSSTEENISEDVITQTQNFTFVETIDAKAYEGNQVSVTLNAVDRSENKSAYTQELKIDVTKPEIEITFDNENARNGKYYNLDRRAKIKITELNFDPALVEIHVKRDGEKFSPAISEWHSDNETDHYAYIDFTADGDYTLKVKCKDLADNEAEEKNGAPFTIDKTMPRVSITLENGDLQRKCFKETQTAVITVIEHNFNANDVWINTQPVGKIGAWEHRNDTHVIKVQFLSEGENSLSCDYKDLAGNDMPEEDKTKMPLELIIDKTAPVISISGVKNDSANAGAVVPVISVLDANMDPLGTAITLTTGRGAAVDIVSDITAGFADGSFVYTLDGLDAKQDDIYYLTVNAVDEAENRSELTYRFSLNRRGSTYDVTDLAKIMEKYYNSSRTLEDIKIIEMNVDKVEDFELYLSHNTDIIYGKQGNRPLYTNENAMPSELYYGVEVSGSEETGYVYTYTVYRENFALEGTYRLGIYSRDRAGNEVNNLLRLNGEEIQFVIDNTLPRVMIEGIENNEIYDVASKEVRIAADDNFKLASAEITLVNSDNEVLERWNYFDLVQKEGDTAVISIGEHKEEVSLLYCATDAAGNEVRALQGEKTAKADFLVTTDKFVQLVNKPTKTPIGRGIIILFAFLGVSATGVFAVVWKKRFHTFSEM